jgi:glycerol-3-phosphate dehydrogenase (NAD(P)+)
MTGQIAVLGAGAWGVTLADLLARKGMEVRLWDIDEAHLLRIRETREPGKPPGLRVADSLAVETDFAAAAAAADVLVCAVPSFAVRSLCERLKALLPQLGERLFVCVSKGIEEETLLLPSQVFGEFYGQDALDHFATLSGPSHAEEVCRRIPTVVVSSSSCDQTAGQVRDLFFLPEFRVYTHGDARGVELGAALKNVIAIAAGACDGLGYGDNTKAALVTRGLAEMTRCGVAMGADARTFAGLAGLGDLIVTAMSRHSRNRGFGELIARGSSPADALKEIGQVVEGYRTSHSAHDLAAKIGVEMPLTDCIYAVVHEGVPIRDAVAGLLSRDPKPEVY